MNNESVRPMPVFPQSGLADPVCRVLAATESAYALGDELLFQARTVHGGAVVTLLIVRSGQFRAEAHSELVLQACRMIDRAGDLEGFLLPFPTVRYRRWSQGDPDQLYAEAFTVPLLAEATLVLRDACLAVLAAAVGLAMVRPSRAVRRCRRCPQAITGTSDLCETCLANRAALRVLDGTGSAVAR